MTARRRHLAFSRVAHGDYTCRAGDTACGINIGADTGDVIVRPCSMVDDDWEGGYIACPECLSAFEAFNIAAFDATRRTTMKIEYAHIDKLVLEEEDFFANPRELISKRDIRELADSIANDGLIQPLRGLKRGDKVVVVEGGRRTRAIRLLVEEKRDKGLGKKVPIIYLPSNLDVQGARVTALVANLHRKDLSSYEMAKELVALKDAGLSQAEIAKKISKSQSWVSRLLGSFVKSSDDVRKAWAAGKLPDDDVQQLAKLPPATQDQRLEKIVAARAQADVAKPGQRRQAKSAARAVAKGKNGESKDPPAPKSQRPDAKLIRSYADITAKAPKSNKYIRGMCDAFRFMLGDIGPGEFDAEFRKWAADKAKGTDAQKRLSA